MVGVEQEKNRIDIFLAWMAKDGQFKAVVDILAIAIDSWQRKQMTTIIIVFVLIYASHKHFLFLSRSS